MTRFEARLSADIIQHAINRIGVVLSDTVDLLPTEEAVLQLYAMVLAHAMASTNRGFGETKPLYGKLSTAQRIGIISTLVGHVIDPNDETHPSDLTAQYISDSIAATQELKPFFNFRVIFDH